MIDLVGMKLSGLNFQLVHLGDLLAYEGPLLSHCVDQSDPTDHYLYKWCDVDDHAHRWMIFKVTENELSAFFRFETTLLEMVKSKRFVYFQDKNGEFIFQTILVSIENIPDAYLPGVDSGFEEIGFEEYAFHLKSKFRKTKTVSKTFKIIG